MKKTIPSLLGAGAGHLAGAVKSTTSVGSKTKRFFVRLKNDFQSGYHSAQNDDHDDVILPY